MAEERSIGDAWPGQVIQQAVLYDNVELLQCLLEGEELDNINATDTCGRTAVYTAVSNNSLRCLRLLLEYGADANIAAGGRCQNMTPLHLAVLDSKHEVLKQLLQNGVTLTPVDESGQAPLALARVIGNSTSVTMMENEHERRTEILKHLSSKLCSACASSCIDSVQEVLNECGANKEQVLNLIPDYDLPPLCSASSAGSLELVDLLVKNGAAPVCQRGSGLSPVHLACLAGHPLVVQRLLKEYPDLAMARSVDHRLPLHVAAAFPRAESLRLILNHDYPDNLLQTFVHAPSGHKYKAGFDVNAQDCLGKMPLHVACQHGFMDNVTALLNFALKMSEDDNSNSSCGKQEEAAPAKGGQPCPHPAARHARSRESVRSHSGYSVREPSLHSLHSLHSRDSTPNYDHTPSPGEGVGEPLSVHPTLLNHRSNEGLSPLHYAIKNHHLGIVQTLIQAGVDVRLEAALQDRNVSPLAFAFEHQELAVMRLLLEVGVEDDNNHILQGAFMCQDNDVIALLLQFKSVRDPVHGIKRSDLWRLSGQGDVKKSGSLERGVEGDIRPKSLALAVAIQWQGLGALHQIDADCLISASLRLNPTLGNLEPSTALCCITKVDISGNSFRQFPECLLMLPSLVVLNASKNSIVEMPEEDEALPVTFGCPSLEELHLQENKFQSLPAYVFRFPALKYLDLSFNNLKELPPDMWLAPSLITLNLTRNSLTKLPLFSKELSIPRKMSSAKRMSGASLGGAGGVSQSDTPSVCSFDMEGSGSVYDDSMDNVDIFMCSSVTTNEVVHVNRWSSSLKVVDRDPWKNSGAQAGLQQLNLSRNRLAAFPTCLPCLAPNLEVLNLSENPLDGVAPISDIPLFLKELSLQRCQLRDLLPWRKRPDTVKDAGCFGAVKMSSYTPRYSNSPSSRVSPSLASRDSFSSMGVACLHRAHCSLPRLEKLNLSHNKLDSVVLTRAPDGQSLNGDTRSISSFGLEAEELQQRLLFPALTDLDLSINLLQSLTSDIGEQTALKILSLRGNRSLRELPSKLGLLKNLWKLDLELCPLDGVIHDLLQSSRFPVRDILGFLQSVLEESTFYNSMNLMLVGCHKIGKTSLLNRLRKEGRAPTKPTHWRDRVSNEEVRPRGKTLSTVGIDINELILDCGSKGLVHFRTWDFGGQREYYATHQYFLSPRSLYLVMWSIIEGERGVEGLQQWLINIQARAPGAPVIIVGTHLDVLRDKATRRNFPADFEEAMTGMVQKLFLSNSEPDKCGLPNILDAINISCKTGENVRRLVDTVKNVVFELKHARSKTVKLLGQKIPRKYLLLQTVVRELAMERIHDFKDPVLTRDKYMLCVSNKMMEKGFTTFRGAEELEQATRFLHENGVLFHWDDHALKELYFLDPQWLCDQLAKVITVREINNFAQRGVMRISNLEFLFRSTTFQPEDVRQYITSLLAKFEVALQFDDDHLILPSLLPLRLEPGNRRQGDTKIPLRRPCISQDTARPHNSGTRQRYESLKSGRADRRPRVDSGPDELHIGSSVFYAGSQVAREPPETQVLPTQSPSSNLLLLAVKPCSNPIFSFCRLYFMTYFPSGFWSRLIVRVLADTTLYSVVRSLFRLPDELLSKSPEIRALVDREPEWHCWQSGLELLYMGFEMVRVREVTVTQGPVDSRQLCDYSLCRFKCSVEREWCYLDAANSRILEITFPTDLLHFHLSQRRGPMLQLLDLSNTTSVVRGERATTKLLVKVVEHIDNLLQDWYPELGEIRFHQNCEGRYLVTRAVPCPRCLAKEVTRQKSTRQDKESWFFVDPEAPDIYTPFIVSQDSYVSRHSSLQTLADTDAPGGGGATSLPALGHNRSLSEGQAFIYNRETSMESNEGVIFSFLVERCMLDVMQGVDTVCPLHGSISPQHLLDTAGVSHPYYIAPDVVFSDLDNDIQISNTDHLKVGICLGEGNFGKVYEGSLHRRGGPPEPVALKILFEADRGRRTTNFQGFQLRLETACSAYLTARQEVSILEQLCHEHIVPFLGLALQPLCLVLGLAPHGALSAVLRKVHDAGTRLPLFVVRKVIIQVASALEYLHNHSVIYRDLKSENVLVWDLPLSPDVSPNSLVHVKIADYGISRTVLPTGARGFGGTPAFIAPEILQHAGRGTYNEKVDIFSLGIFIFELTTCRFPFLDIGNPNTLVCQGGRPSLTTQEVEQTPTCLLDLLTVCWSQEPADRPSAASVVSMVTSPQFCHLRDSLSLGPDVGVLCGLALPSTEVILDVEPGFSGSTSSEVYSHVRPCQVWFSSCTGNTSALEMFSFGKRNTVVDYKTLPLNDMSVITMCVVDNSVWCADEEGVLHVYDIDTLAVTNQLRLPTESPITVLSLHVLPGMQSVVVVASQRDCSIIYLCRRPQLGGLMGDAEAEQFKVFRCYCSTLVRTVDRCELWLGQASGGILVWDVTKHSSVDCLYHTVDKLPASTCCIFLVSPQPSTPEQAAPYVWSYNFPGTVVYCWDIEKRCIVERLDCSAIYSTADTTSLGSPQRMEAAQVTVLNVINGYLYIGNTRGRIIVAEALTMKPLCAFPAHSPREFYVRCILPILGRADTCGDTDLKDQGIVSVGRGYVDLMNQGVDGAGRKGGNAVGAGGRGQVAAAGDGYAHHTFLLSWSTQDWEYY
ncbi:LOW QUALITY PROTEIN: leucine-rich repeat serine/threonine-protein kinase 1-like [Babylonia areolata]|uniref:LOW QUALITY PROTEIN: leucine-rich repeat serine/threonine-protein kinase 1-like n=1 Tax=Babylonia areolata TaxID=304850 RepID=UPI003FD12296